MKTFAAIAGGLLYALACVVLGVMLAAGGHGWIAPVFVSLLGLALFPLSLWCGLHWRHPRAATVSRVAIALILTADLLLVVVSISEGLRYVQAVAPYGYVWIALWLFGQWPPLWTIARIERRRAEQAR